MTAVVSNCNLWGKVFTTRSSLLDHRKKEHGQAVQKCKNANNGVCIFGNEKCWFIHDNMKSNENMNNENEKNRNNIKQKDTKSNENYVIQKMMNMMETCTERILRLEERNLE